MARPAGGWRLPGAEAEWMEHVLCLNICRESMKRLKSG